MSYSDNSETDAKAEGVAVPKCQTPTHLFSRGRNALSLPYPDDLLRVRVMGFIVRSCMDATKQLLNGHSVFRWHHLWLFQLCCKKWVTTQEGWCNLSALCWATELWLLIHNGFSRLLTPKTWWLHLHSAFSSTAIKLYFVQRSNYRRSVQNSGFRFISNQGHDSTDSWLLDIWSNSSSTILQMFSLSTILWSFIANTRFSILLKCSLFFQTSAGGLSLLSAYWLID